MMPGDCIARPIPAFPGRGQADSLEGETDGLANVSHGNPLKSRRVFASKTIFSYITF